MLLGAVDSIREVRVVVMVGVVRVGKVFADSVQFSICKCFVLCHYLSTDSK